MCEVPVSRPWMSDTRPGYQPVGLISLEEWLCVGQASTLASYARWLLWISSLCSTVQS